MPQAADQPFLPVNTDYTPVQLLQGAYTDYRKGFIARAELLCRRSIQLGNKDPAAFDLLGMVALSVHLPSQALHYFDQALAAELACDSAAEHRKAALAQLQHETVGDTSAGFLLVKAWGHGFWSDMDHVLGQLLLAEITGRTPVVHWAEASLFSDAGSGNAFNLYFQALSDDSIEDLADAGYSYFPDKWTATNLARDNHDKFSGKGSRLTALYYLNRKETVLVSDYHTFLNDLLPWIPDNHPLSGNDAESIYRHLCKKYLRPRDGIKREIEQFRKDRLQGKKCIAVHVRGSDKINEASDLDTINASYFRAIEGYLAKDSHLSIFLLTDSDAVCKAYHDHYPGRIISTECTRTDSNEGVHKLPLTDKTRAAVEVIKDVWLAAACDYFVGNGYSNVSTSILHLKDWQPDSYTLLGENRLYVPHHLREIY